MGFIDSSTPPASLSHHQPQLSSGSASFQKQYDSVNPENPGEAFIISPDYSIPYQGEPYVVAEYGGTFWTREYTDMVLHLDTHRRNTVGYGKTADQVEDIIADLTEILLNNPNIAGYCYTELYDIEQEVNGIYTYEREPKFNIKHIKEIFGAHAAIERKSQ